MNAESLELSKPVHSPIASPVERLLSSLPTEASIAMTGEGQAKMSSSGFSSSTPSTSPPLASVVSGFSSTASATFPMTSSLHYQPSSHDGPATEINPLTFGSEFIPHQIEESFTLCATGGISSMSSLAFSNRRRTLPFIADDICVGGGSLDSSGNTTQRPLLAVVNIGATKSTQDRTHASTDAEVPFVCEEMPGEGHEHSLLGLLGVPLHPSARNSATEVSDAERDRCSSIPNHLSAVKSDDSYAGGGQASDVPYTKHLSLRAADIDFSTVSESEGALLGVCAARNGMNTGMSVASRQSEYWVPDGVSTTGPAAAAAPAALMATATVSVASAHLISQHLMSTSDSKTLAMTIPATVAMAFGTSQTRNGTPPPRALPEVGESAHASSFNDRDGTTVSKEGVVKVLGGGDGRRTAFGLASEAEMVSSSTKDEYGSDSSPPMGFIPLSTLLLTEARKDISTGSLTTIKTSKSTQQPPSSMQILVSSSGASVVTDISVSNAMQSRSPPDTSATASKRESQLQTTGVAKEHSRDLSHTPAHLTVPFDENGNRGQSSTYDDAATSAEMELSSLLSVVSLSSPELSSSLRFEGVPRRVTVSFVGEVEPTSSLEANLNRPNAGIGEGTKKIISVRSPSFVWGIGVDSAPTNPHDPSSSVPAHLSMDGRHTAGAHASSREDHTVSTDAFSVFFPSLRLSTLSKWMGWLRKQYRGVLNYLSDVSRDDSSPQPRSSSLTQNYRWPPRTQSYDESSTRCVSFSPGCITEGVESPGVALCDSYGLKDRVQFLPMALSFSAPQLHFGDEGERSRCRRNYEAPGGGADQRGMVEHNSWFSLGSHTGRRPVVGATGMPMQLRHSVTSSSMARDALFPRSSEEWRAGSITPLSFSLVGDSRAASSDTLEVSEVSGNSLQRLCLRLDGTKNSKTKRMNHSGSYPNASLASLTGHHTSMSRSHTNAIADDSYRDILYHLFRHPPSSRIGDLNVCYEAYNTIADTSSNGRHLFNWGELSLLLLPEDYIDYRALFPTHHFVDFHDFVEFVEVMSVRYHR